MTQLNKILPKPKPAGNYSFLEQVKTKSYRLLCHAEIEFYLEEVCKSAIDKIYLVWQSSQNNTKTYILVHLFAMLGWRVERNTEKKTETRLWTLVDIYKKSLKSNNGIKEANLNSMLKPLGIDMNQYNTLVIDLDAFGADRGSIAHTALTTHQIIDPVSEKNRVMQILENLKDLDAEMYQLIK